MPTTPVQPAAQASYSGGSSMPAVGSPEYTAAQDLARTAPPARVNPDTIGSSSVEAEPYKAVNGLYYDSNGAPSIGSAKEIGDITAATAEKYRQQAQQITDVINTKYASKVENDKTLIANNDARARVLNTRTGTTDSATGESAIAANQEKGNKVLAADEASRIAELSNALGNIDRLQSGEQKANEAQARNDLVTAQSLRAKNKTDAETSLKALGTGGVDLETLKEKEPDAYNSLLQTTGLSPLELEAKFNTYKSAANQTKWQYKVSGDTVSAYGVDSKGQLRTQEQTVPGLSAGNYTIMKGDNGTLYKINKDTNEVTPLVNAAKPIVPKPPTPTKDTKDTQTTAQKNEQADALNWLALQPGYNASDKEKFQSDETFRAWAINQAKIAKPAKTKTAAGSRTI